MIKIITTSDVRKSANAKRVSSTSASFEPAASRNSDAPTVAATNPTQKTQTLTALISLQSDQGGRAKTIVAAQRILEALDDLQVMLLEGRANQDDLAALKSTAALRANAAADPAVLDIYDQIELRARVELAKLDRAADH